MKENKKLKEPLTNKEKVDELRKKLFTRISMKEEEIKERIDDDNSKKLVVTSETRDIAKMIFLHYKVRDVENMFFVGVVNYIKKNLS